MRFAIPLDSDYFKHLVCPYEVKEDLIVKGKKVKRSFCVAEVLKQYTSFQIFL